MSRRVLFSLAVMIHIMRCSILYRQSSKYELPQSMSQSQLSILLNYNMGIYPTNIDLSDLQPIDQYTIKSINQIVQSTLIIIQNSNTNPTQTHQQSQCKEYSDQTLCQIKYYQQSSPNSIHTINIGQNVDSQQLDQLLTYLAKSQNKQILLTHSWTPQFRMLEQTLQVSASTNSGNVSQTHTQVQIWFTLVLVFVLFYAVSALFNMDNSGDTLLYAKFIAGDKM